MHLVEVQRLVRDWRNWTEHRERTQGLENAVMELQLERSLAD